MGMGGSLTVLLAMPLTLHQTRHGLPPRNLGAFPWAATPNLRAGAAGCTAAAIAAPCRSGPEGTVFDSGTQPAPNDSPAAPRRQRDLVDSASVAVQPWMAF